MKNIFRFSLVVSIVIVVFCLSACKRESRKETDGANDKISYAVPQTIAAMPAYVAIANKYWEEEGLEVDTKIFSSGRLALDGLLSKNVEVMSSSETPLVHSILKGSKIFIVATIMRHQEVKFIGRRDHGISAPSDFVGKTIATLPGTNSDFFMYKFFKHNKIDIKNIKVVNMSPPEMVTALVSGNIDGYFAWEPYIYNSQAKLPKSTVIFNPGNLYYGRHCVAMNQDFVNAEPKVVEKFLRGLIRAEDFIKKNPGTALEITSKAINIPVKILEILLPEYHPIIELDSNLVGIVNQEGQWAESKTTSDRKINIKFDDFIFTESLQKIKPSAVTIKIPEESMP
ncbi:ABC transporter substrate-binding protein [Dyadobacter frigoris]|uniref:Transporter substrate-binding domain-containing protein n=1 Tax=Dyadobacter frigoris TaxID=2576211 RepID=A0A4U6DFI0_9BACT|nr:NrtA/SsuA/CpmA family ABC transporter substrate-binding protein [Dyadobacter frigoris]TKT93324.1 transporter substrate-binding domain-containing protein [Dyadobacter frigoris]